MRFAEGGSIDASIPAPYLTIAQEIAAYDDRNYPGIAPANPARSAVRLQDAVVATSSEDVAASAGEVTIEVSDAKGFVAGLPVVIDAYDKRGIQEAPMLLRVADPTHIVVASLAHGHQGTTTPFPVVQPGERGTLIAEWNEHTPSSGTDIAVGSDLQTVA